MHKRDLAFQGATGEQLSASLDLPANGEPRGCALLAHCFADSGGEPTGAATPTPAAVDNLSRALTHERIAVLRLDVLDPRGSGGRVIADMAVAARALEEQGLGPVLLVGHSLGGAAVIRAAAQIPSARAVVTIGAPFASDRHPLQAGWELPDDLQSEALEQALRDLRRPLLILHSPVDEMVGIDNAARIFFAARHPKSFVSLDQADHLLTDDRDACFAGTVLAGWASRYLPQPPPRVVEDPATGDRVVAVTGRIPFRTEVLAGGHALLADEPLRLGGQDAGPTPYDFLMTALGTCTGITLRMYADRKGWPLEEITVRLNHRKQRSAEGAQLPGGEIPVDHIEEILELRGPLDEEQRARLTEISARCPVYRTLKAGVQIETRLAGVESQEAVTERPAAP